MVQLIDGTISVADARRFDLAVIIAALTRLGVRAVRNRLEAANGHMFLCNAFERDWPDRVNALAALGNATVAQASHEFVRQELANLTKLPVGMVGRLLDAAPSDQSLEYTFRDRWPEIDLGDDESAEPEAESIPWVRTPDEIAEMTAAAARVDSYACEIIAALVGMTPRRVRNQLNRSAGRMLVRNVFREQWQVAPEPTVSQRQASDDEEDVPPGGDALSGVTSGPKGRAHQALRVGQIVNGRYELIERLGRGGFGEAWLAKDARVRSEFPFVLKFANVTDPHEALRVEFETTLRLSHPNICKYLHFDEDAATRRPFIVMEYAGRSLAQRLEDGEEFTVERVVEITSAVAEALEFAHSRKVIHHDVSPANLMVDDEGIVRVGDFGISVLGTLRSATGGGHTMAANTMIGRHPVYSAPEILRGLGATRRSDQYSLALVACSLLEGEVFMRPYTPRRFGRLGARQNAALAKALAEDPRNRFPSCAEFVQALR